MSLQRANHTCLRPLPGEETHPWREPVALAERFWMKVAGPWLDGVGQEDCWLWVRAIVAWDYGRIRDGNRMRGAHVVAYELANGPVPPGLEVAHNCHVGLCCNPGHLVAQTHLENVRASVERARRRRGGVAA